MDYFSAMFSILIPLHYTLHRIFNIIVGSLLSVIISIVSVMFYIIHVSYLSFYKFDYGYNMKASVTIGLFHSILWLLWCAYHHKRPYAWKQARVVLLLILSMSLELLDFPPLFGLLDAHALWHLSTVWIVYLHWNFSIEDALFEIDAGGNSIRRYDMRSRK